MWFLKGKLGDDSRSSKDDVTDAELPKTIDISDTSRKY